MIQNINDYKGQWANGVSIGQLWESIKADFLAGGGSQSDTTAYPESWRQQARANLGLTIGANKIWYGSAANTIGQTDISTLGMAVLNAQNNTMVSNLFAERAQKDESGNNIKSNYAHSLDTNGGYLRLMNNASTPAYLSRIALNDNADGLVQLSGGKIPLKLFPDAILGQQTLGGTITDYVSDTRLKINITNEAASILEVRKGYSAGTLTASGVNIYLENLATPTTQSGSNYYFNYEDCKGMYFIWKASAMGSTTPAYRMWKGKSTDTSAIRFQTGDWLLSLENTWDKVDNTDAVTTVSGNYDSLLTAGSYNITGDVVMTAQRVGALDRFILTQQDVASDVEFKSDIWALGGVAAHGITDLSIGGGGGSGTVTGLKVGDNGSTLTPAVGEGVIVIPVVQTGDDLNNGEFSLGGTVIKPKGLAALAYKTSLSLTELTDAADIKAIELVSGTGFLKRTGDNTWALDNTSYLSLAGGTMANTNVVTNLNADLLDGHDSDYFATASSLADYALKADVENYVQILSAGLGSLQGSLGSMAYREDTEFATSEEFGVVRNYFDENGVIFAENMSASNIVSALGNTPVNRATADASGNTIASYYQPKVSALGSATEPVYISAAGTFSKATKYAGGTAVTVNGASQAGQAVAFYAPASGGTAYQVLVAGGTEVPPEWVDQSTLNVGQLGGHAASYFATVGTNEDITGQKTFLHTNFGTGIEIKRNNTTEASAIKFSNNAGTKGYLGFAADGVLKVWNSDVSASYKIWHEGNDGAGSGLDADTLDGVQLANLFSDLSSSTTNAISATIGGVTKNITPATLRTSMGLSIEKGKNTISTTDDEEWFKVSIGSNKLYVRFQVNDGQFELEFADDSSNPTQTKSFAFDTLSASEVQQICVW